jgi:hypothetical protein
MHKAMVATLGLLAALNILVVAVYLSRPSKAATPSFQELVDNPDFARGQGDRGAMQSKRRYWSAAVLIA